MIYNLLSFASVMQTVGSILVAILILLATITVHEFGHYIVGKIFKFSWQMACGIACSCLFGFPGTFVVSTEVSKQIGTTDDERQMLLDNIMPKMLVAGFVCLTITSVVITGVFVNYLVV